MSEVVCGNCKQWTRHHWHDGVRWGRCKLQTSKMLYAEKCPPCEDGARKKRGKKRGKTKQLGLEG